MKSRQELCGDVLHHWNERQEVIEQVSPVVLVVTVEETSKLRSLPHGAHLLGEVLTVSLE
jgi:hypothetical protein